MQKGFLVSVRNLALLAAISLSLFLTSCGQDSKFKLEIPGVQGPNVSLIQDVVLIDMVFEKLSIDGGLRYAIPEYNNSYLEVSPDLSSGGTLFAAYLSLKDIFNGDLLLLDPQYLPGGRPLPGVSKGSLPAVAVTVPQFENITFYVGTKAFGLFVPFKLDIGSTIVTARFYIGDTRAGNVSLVGPDENDENSGVLLLIDLNAQQIKRLKNYAAQF